MPKPMSPADELAAHALDLLESGRPGTNAEPRRMFGGVGLFDGDAMFAVAINDAFYFKTDGKNNDDYDALDLPALTFMRGSKEVRMSFRQPPDSALERADEFVDWYQPALEAARRSARKRGKKSSGRKKQKKTMSSGARKKKPSK